MEENDRYMLSALIVNLQTTIKEYGDMPVSKLGYYEDEEGNAAMQIVGVGGYCVKEPSEESDVEERTIVLMDAVEMELLGPFDEQSGSSTTQ